LIIMNYQNKTKTELIKELLNLQKEYDSLITSCEKDIIRLNHTGETFWASIEHNRTLFNAIDEGFCIVEVIFDKNEKPIDYRFMEVNQSFEKQTGLVNAQGKRMRELKPKHEEHWFEIYGKIAVTGQPVRFENRAEQLHRWYDVYAFRFGQPENRQVAVLFNDISERKRVEKELLLQGEILKNISEGINLIRVKDEVIVFTNSKFDKMFGYYSEELIGKHVSILNAPSGKSPEEIKQDIADIAKRTGEWHGEILNKKKNGDYFWCYANVSTFDHPDHGKVYISVHTDITERKQDEEALYLEKENFRHSLDDSPLGVRIATIKGDTIYANKTLLGFYGYESLEELQVTPLKNRYTPESYILSRERKRQREQGDFSITDYEISIIQKDGEIRHLQVFRKEIVWTGIKQFQVVYEDITRRKLAETALKESEARFRSLFENSFVGISIVHPGGRLLHVNLAYARMYGYENPEKMLAEVTNVGKLYANPADRKEVLSNLTKIGFMEAKEVEVIRRNGSRFFVLVSAREIRDTEGKLLYNQATQIDLTQRKKIEEKIRETSFYARNLIEASLDPFITINGEGKITDVNSSTEQITGIKREKLIGSDFAGYFTEPDKARKGYKIVFLKGMVKDYPLTILNTSGRTIDVLYNATLFKNEAGEVQGVFAAARDITDRKKMEEELRNSKELLERLNIHLTEIREEERASISREIHDQLGQSMTALKLDLNRMHKYINTNPEALVKLEGMIKLVSDTIKDVQRISSDLRPGILDELGLVSAIEWYCDEFEKRTGIKCILKLDDADFNDSQINLVFFRVLQETLTNVIRHAKASSVSIKLIQLKKGATMTIQDNGIGIPAEMIGSSKSLGLISMRERVKQFNGTIDISSKKDCGTKLIIFIPS
jgi:PAS domain S-box-containing protein